MRKSVTMLAMCFVAGFALAAQQPAAPKPQPKATAGKPAPSAQAKIRQAMSAAPADVARDAAIMDWPDTPGGEMKELRKGSNGWTCMPSTPIPGASGEDPMCLDATFQEWADAWQSKRDPQLKGMGLSYMLRGDKGASNTDPFATGPTADNQWVVTPAHVMIVTPDTSQLEGLSTDPQNGGPWVMWKGTKYAHIMMPVAPMSKGAVGTAGTKPADRRD